MLKARAGDVVLLGITAETVTRLMQGHAMRFDCTELGAVSANTQFLLFYGHTPRDLIATLEAQGLTLTAEQRRELESVIDEGGHA